MRFPGSDGAALWDALKADRSAIDQEFQDQGLPALSWIDDEEVPSLGVTHPSPAPWDAAAEVAQRQWLGQVANQLVNSLRPRLQRFGA